MTKQFAEQRDYVEVGVMTSTVLLVLDFLEPALPTELASVLGTLLLCGD